MGIDGFIYKEVRRKKRRFVNRVVNFGDEIPKRVGVL